MREYLVGIKGTGMSHLAGYLAKAGDDVCGEDIAEDFYTAPLLDGIDIRPHHVPDFRHQLPLIYEAGLIAGEDNR